ncbi:universal stress protein [Dyella nitratireducens]|uniref:Universal stress protein UspA n=1 Tax=Dyella nitratireducens TaxID=1849580 RepID=A0ABQ1GGM2_9GAMM|nr:universal stress protein [Dyella nitratireducens]GGA43072.1 universal stress protein UspA [Dyella nitratireducens]GLQ41920.1 universal stress protein UspA [Dyella nitratireducens]
MFSHILVPTDGSDQAMHAAEIGIDLARSLGARIYAFHVLAPLAAVAYFSDVIRHREDSHTERAVTRAQQRLAEIEAMANQAGVACHGGYAFDHRPYTAIVGAAKMQHCDLIVMSMHGYATLDRMLLGSETNRVLGCCDIPVLVCH